MSKTIIRECVPPAGSSPEPPAGPAPLAALVSSQRALLHQHAVLDYYVLTFAISWGGFLLVGGPGLISGTAWQTDPRFMGAVGAMIVGPPVAGVLLTGLTDGRPGLRELVRRLLHWRVNAGWFAIALLPAPLLGTVVLLALSLDSPVYLPTIVTTADRPALLLAGLGVGLLGGLLEELGWTGFAIPRLRLRHRVLTTGLIVGVLWAAWHALQMFWVGRTSSEGLPLALFLAQYFCSAAAALTAYRVLMVWVYGRTGSLLLAVLMHASYIASTLFILAPPTTGAAFLIYAWAWAAALWLLDAIVALTISAPLRQRPATRMTRKEVA